METGINIEQIKDILKEELSINYKHNWGANYIDGIDESAERLVNFISSKFVITMIDKKKVKLITCFACGSIVKTKLSKIEGMITCQSIRFDKIQYEISYFLNGEQKTIWMNENEFEVNIEREIIGFIKK